MLPCELFDEHGADRTGVEKRSASDRLNADTTGSGIGDRVLAASGYTAANSDLDGDG
jgi:microcompartment protein CcmK/EutM